MADSRLTFDVLAKDRASSTFKKVGRSADDTGRRFGFLSARAKHMSAGLRVGFGAVAAALGGLATISVFKSFISEARESVKVSRITAQVIKTTGGAANVTAKQVGILSNRLSEQAGIDDELVQTGANLLLTFKNVRNELGKGNQVFDRATAAAVDLSAAGFGSVQSASKMLGKALNDPIKGLTALGRAGVTFTEQQKEQIKTLVEAGDVLSAQKIILQEVESQVGGAAKAAADPMDRLAVVVNNLKERLGTALLPAITTAANFLADKLPGAVEIVLDAFGDMVTFIKTKVVPPIKNAFGGISEIVDDAVETVRGFVDKIDFKAIMKKSGDLFKAAKTWGAIVVSGLIAGAKTGDWSDLGKTIADGILKAAGAVQDITGAILALFKKVNWFKLGQEVGFQAASFGLGFISKLIDGLISAAVHHPVDFALAIVSALGVGAIGGRIAQVLSKIPFLRVFAPIFSGLNKLTGPLNRAIGRVVSIFGFGFREGFARHFPGVYSALRRNLDGLILRVLYFVERMANAGRALVRGLGRGIGSAVGFVIRQLARIPKAIINFFSNSGSWLVSAGRNLIGGFILGIKSKVGDLLGTISDIAGKVRDYLPFSPAKKGPLSGRGNPFYSGQSIGRLLSQGMDSSRGKVATSAAALAGSVRFGAPLTPGTGGTTITAATAPDSGSIVINGGLHLHNVQDIHQLVRELQLYAKRNGGLKIRIAA